MLCILRARLQNSLPLVSGRLRRGLSGAGGGDDALQRRRVPGVDGLGRFGQRRQVSIRGVTSLVLQAGEAAVQLAERESSNGTGSVAAVAVVKDAATPSRRAGCRPVQL